MLLKDICSVSRQHWNDELPKDAVEKFLEWSVKLLRLFEVTIPRSKVSGNFEHLKLHVIGDSSQQVFSAVAFIRVRETTSIRPQTELLFSLVKAGVAPILIIIVPKLELQAALLAA